MSISEKIKSQLRKFNLYVKARSIYHAIKFAQNPFLNYARPGHFYSPIPDMDYIQKNKKRLFNTEADACPGIKLHVKEQLRLAEKFAEYYSGMPFKKQMQDGYRYYFENQHFGYGSAIALYSIMRHFKPKRIIEAGSGFSSAAILDINDRFFNGSIQCTFIEPYPEERLLLLLNEKDKKNHRIYSDIAQDIPKSIYTELQNNDILFIDSSHVAKIGSDVNFFLTDIIPNLEKGVIIHFHDIFWPFEYPEKWIHMGRAWNEAYMIKAFLQFNNSFEILLFNSYLAIHHQDFIEKHLPLFMENCHSSLWIKKTS